MLAPPAHPHNTTICPPPLSSLPQRFLDLPTALGWLDDQSVQVSVKNEEKLDLKFLFCVFAMRQIEGLIPGCPGVKIVIFVHEPN